MSRPWAANTRDYGRKLQSFAFEGEISGGIRLFWVDELNRYHAFAETTPAEVCTAVRAGIRETC